MATTSLRDPSATALRLCPCDSGDGAAAASSPSAVSCVAIDESSGGRFAAIALRNGVLRVVDLAATPTSATAGQASDRSYCVRFRSARASSSSVDAAPQSRFIREPFAHVAFLPNSGRNAGPSDAPSCVAFCTAASNKVYVAALPPPVAFISRPGRGPGAGGDSSLALGHGVGA